MTRRISACLTLLALALVTSVAQADPDHSESKPRMAAVKGPTKAPPARSLAAANGDDKRYALANGCYALRSRSAGAFATRNGGGYSASAGAAGAAEGFRMQATELGRYLLYGRGRDFLTGNSSGGVVSAGEPSEMADWRVDVVGSGFKLTLPSVNKVLAVGAGNALVLADPNSGDAAIFGFEPGQGCAVYPEVETSASGKTVTTKTPWGEVKGTIDLHMHMMAFEFLGGRAHCGKPWHRYGAPYALTDCPDHQVGNGCGAALENVLYGSPARCHDPVGWPTFKDWPHPKSLTHEQTYYKWLERAHMAGLRVMVNLFVENKVLCELYPLKQNSCDEMESVRLQARRIRELENYIDAQNGGPGRGWFRITSDPFEARRLIAQGKLAVIPGIEVSQPFGCRLYNDQPLCDKARIDRELAEVYDRYGVRQMEIIDKFDNALAGVAGDSGQTGVVVNSGNRYETGRYWDMQACNGPPDEADKPQIGVYEHDHQDLGSNLLEQFVPRGAAPIYPRGANCNAKGLSELGEHAIRRLMERNMIIDPDHLSTRARKNVMSLLEAERYSGVVSSHSWSTPDINPRVFKLGGLITPMQDKADDWVKNWREVRAKRDSRFYFGFGYGADQNGFATQFGPRNGPNPVTYPFKSVDGGVTFQRQRSGAREFDLNRDGMAHYGLFADWFEDMRKVGGQGIVNEMMRGAEAYLQTWERANGISFGCKSGREHFTARGLGRLYLRNSSAQLLRRGGQPQSRGDRTWRWCALRKKNRGKKIVAVLDRKGRVALVGSNAHGHRGLKIRVGLKAKRLRGKARRIGKRLFIRSRGRRARLVYGVRRGRVSFVAVATRTASKKRKTLRAYLRLARLR